MSTQGGLTLDGWQGILARAAEGTPEGAAAACEAMVQIAPRLVVSLWTLEEGSSLARCVAVAGGTAADESLLAALEWRGRTLPRWEGDAPWAEADRRPTVRGVRPTESEVWVSGVTDDAPAAVTVRINHEPERSLYFVMLSRSGRQAARVAALGELAACITRQRPRGGIDFRELAESNPNITLVLQHARIVYANAATLTTLGYGRRELTDADFDPFTLIHPRDRDRLRREFAAIESGGAPEEPFEASLLARDGSALDALVSCTLQRGAAGNYIHVNAVNITDRVRLETELFAYTGQVSALQQVLIDILELDLTRSEILERICQSITNIGGAHIVAALLLTPDRAALELSAFHAPYLDEKERFARLLPHLKQWKRLPMELVTQGRMWTAIRRGEPVVVDNALEVDGSPFPELLQALGMGSYLWVPLLQGDADVLGLLYVGFRAPRVSLNESQIQSLSLFASQAALAIQKTTLVEEERKRQRESQQLLEASAALREDLNLAELYERMCTGAKQLVDCQFVSLVLPEDDTLRVRCVVGDAPAQINDVRFPLDTTLGGRAFRTGRTVRENGLTPERSGDSARLLEMEMHQVLLVPLKSHRQTVGVLCLVNKAGNEPFTERDQQLIETFAQQAAGTADNAALLREVTSTKEYLEHLLDSASDIIYTHDLTGQLLTLNAVGRRTGQWDLPDGTLPNIRDIIHEDDLPAAVARIQARLQGELETAPYEIRVRNGRGEYRTLEIATRLIERDGQPYAMLGIGRDVTDRRRMEARLVRSEKLAAMGGLLSGVAHELNNPLTGILGYAELLSMSNDRDVHDQASRIYSEAQRCRAIIDSLLALHPDQVRASEAVACGPLVQQAVALVSYRFESDNVRVRTELPDQLPIVHAPADQLQRALLQVLQNSHEAIVSTGQPGEVVVSADAEGGRVRITVADDGPGVPPDVGDQIFDPFYTTKSDAPGRGLGLSMANNVVVAAGGEIVVQPRSGGGTVVTFSLPVAGDATTVPVPEAAISGGGARSASRVLVVDDEEVISDLLTDLLEMMDHKVDVARDGQAALDLLAQQNYDAIISDIKMPGMGGIELFRQVQSRFPELEHRIIFSSGDTVATETRDFLDQSGRPCINKPFNLSDIRTVLTDVLGAA